MGRPKGSKNGIRQLIDKSCESCGAFFQVEPYRDSARFCSRACQAIGHAKEMFRQSERQCQLCGTSFMARPASEQIYCSQLCANKGIKLNGHGTKSPADMETKACPVCGKEFVARATLYQKFCSKECSNKSYERRIDLVCQVCHKVYSTRAWKTHQKYCSRACRTIGIGKTESYIERAFADGLDNWHIYAVPQYAFGPYTLDFAIPKYRIAIECDGDYWHSLPECVARDRRKDKYLTGKNWLVLRFSETAINTDLNQCLQQVWLAMSLRFQPQ